MSTDPGQLHSGRKAWIATYRTIIGEALKPAPALAESEEAPSWSEIIRRALGLLLTGVGQIVSGPSNGHRLQGLGSALAVMSFIVLIAWLVTELLPALASPSGDESPSPLPSG